MIELDKNKSIEIVDSYPQLIDFNGVTIDQFMQWKQSNEQLIKDTLLSKGAVLFRGVNIDSIDMFENVTEQFAPKFMSYIDGNSPRTKLSSNVYTSTEYDPNHHITLHNELSYSNKWPATLYFCCLVPAEEGGETPIADCRSIVKEMDSQLVEEIEKKDIRYIRNLHGGRGFGPSWQDTFETSSKAEVEDICKKREIEWTWNADESIKLVHTRKGVIRHPDTQEKVWFNQIDQFHPSHLDEEIYETLMMMYNDEEAMPMGVTYGDGTPITLDHINEVKRVVDALEVPVKWEKGDLLVIDNVLSCHGRKPYKGDRKVLVSMS